MKEDYEKAFKLMKEMNDCYETEINILLSRLQYIKNFIKIHGHELPNGKQEISCFKLIDTLNDIINGKIAIELNYE